MMTLGLIGLLAKPWAAALFVAACTVIGHFLVALT